MVICSETNRHHDLVLAAAAAGKHVFAEKPMGIGSAESYEMADALEKAHLIFNRRLLSPAPSPQSSSRNSKWTQACLAKSRAYAAPIATMVPSNIGLTRTGAGWPIQKIAGIGGFGDLGTHYSWTF